MNGDPRIGTEIGGYRIDALIGRGASGGVYVAEQLRLGRKVALKILSPELAADSGFRQRFVRESHLAAEIEHPGIVPVYDAGDEAGTLFMSMRLVEGSDLGSELVRGEMEPERCVRLVTQVAEALDAAHGRGLIHRDVKPANILLAPGSGASERAYLSDFGIAKRSGSLPELTQTGHFVGTVDYVAPEQIRGEDIDGRADQYSLACVLYHCVTGEPPFPRPTAVAVIYAHLNDEPPRPSERRADLKPGLDPVVLRGLAKTADGRFASCTALAAAADAAVRGRATTGVAVATGARRPGHRRRSGSGRPLAMAVGGLVAAVAVVTLVIAFPRSSNDPVPPPPPGTPVARLTWTEVDRTAGLAGRGNQGILRAVVISSGIVAVGYRDSPEGDQDAAVWTSVDAARWAPRVSSALGGPGNQEAKGIVELDGTLVAVGSDDSAGHLDPAVWTSGDEGRVWERIRLDPELGGPGDQVMRRVVVLGDGLVAVGFDGTASGPDEVGDQDMAVWTSPDGVTWTRANTLAFAGPDAEEARSVAVIDGQPVAVGSVTSDGDQDAAVWRFDEDADSWIQVGGEGDLAGPGNQWITEVVAGGPGLVAVGAAGEEGSIDPAVWTSEDGEEWQRAPVDQASLGGEGDQQMLGIAVVGDELVAVGTDDVGRQLNGAIWTSPDGLNWERVPQASLSVTALSGRGEQYVIEVIALEDRVVALGRVGRFDHSDADAWLAVHADGA